MDKHRHELDHIVVANCVDSVGFHAQGGGGPARVREVDRDQHGRALVVETRNAFAQFDEERSAIQPSEAELRSTGTIIVLEGGRESFPLKIDALSAKTRGRYSKYKWLLLSVQPASEGQPERATVWVNDRYRQDFLQIFKDYLDDSKLTKKGLPARNQLIANIGLIRTVTLRDLWTSTLEPPIEDNVWWELWLDSSQLIDISWRTVLSEHDLEMNQGSLQIGDRLVVWVKGTWEQLQRLPFTGLPLAEVRAPSFADTVEDLADAEQQEYVEDLASRIVPTTQSAPAVCLLDTGVLRTHVLLKDSLHVDDHYSFYGGSGTDVYRGDGHGTPMASLALYGDLEPILTSPVNVTLQHRLESVRILPGPGDRFSKPDDYGTVTATAVSLPESTNPQRSRVFSLTLSNEAESEQPGEPTLWSATVDALAVGTEIVRSGEDLRLLSTPNQNSKRLIIVAAGNVPKCDPQYPTLCLNTPIADPAQAWNALTVGAFTELDKVPSDPQYRGWRTVADVGDISPHTRTSVGFDHRRWPIKPDICLEGGNALTNDIDCESNIAPLALRAASKVNDQALTSANATSAATAQAARLAALVMYRYPHFWPETVRGLLAHSAEWTPAMVERLNQQSNKRGRHQLLRQFGWGVPTEASLLNSATNAVTIVAQDSFVPFEGNAYSIPNFRLHSLPWPTEALQILGEEDVRLRVTLSYFIEPSAGRRGWQNKYQYPSHGFRFDLQGNTETPREFIDRINGQQRDDGVSRFRDSPRWFLGKQNRSRGTLHQDQWTGSAAELAQCFYLAVYPVGGWWKNNKRKDRRDLEARYSLIVSLQTQTTDVDLYTPIMNALQIRLGTVVTRV